MKSKIIKFNNGLPVLKCSVEDYIAIKCGERKDEYLIEMSDLSELLHYNNLEKDYINIEYILDVLFNLESNIPILYKPEMKWLFVICLEVIISSTDENLRHLYKTYFKDYFEEMELYDEDLRQFMHENDDKFIYIKKDDEINTMLSTKDFTYALKTGNELFIKYCTMFMSINTDYKGHDHFGLDESYYKQDKVNSGKKRILDAKDIADPKIRELAVMIRDVANN